ncbi:MAG: 1-acyl-sn-glycerol-3-phosphate acyltransferase [Oscillospiraceae bacterium]|nr:1-acyl-sn-glycerol-3-phosphate acyltransferase [Oscillospiraceae bacterium]
MGIRLFNIFAKITGWPLQWLCFRTKVLYEDPSVQKRHIRGSAIVISNHTSIYDYAVFLFVFWTRTIRCQMAELLFGKKPLGWILRALGGIRVDRNTHDFGFVAQSEEILRRGGVVEIFPESRLPREGEERPLPFKPSAAFLALSSGAKVIPAYTNGRYFQRGRAVVLIGRPIDPRAVTEGIADEKERITALNGQMRRRIMELEREYRERCEKR